MYGAGPMPCEHPAIAWRLWRRAISETSGLLRVAEAVCAEDSYVAQGHALRTTLPSDPVAERFFLGLRLTEGIDGPWEPFTESIRQFIDDGLLEVSGTRLRLTPRGVMLSNEVFAEFVGVPA